MKSLKKLAKDINKDTNQRVIVEIESYDDGTYNLCFREDYNEFDITLTKEKAIKYLQGVLFGLELALTSEERRKKYE